MFSPCRPHPSYPFLIRRESKQITRKYANVRNFQEISKENRKTVKHRIKTISNRTPFLWANLPNEYKLATSLHDFKLKIKNWHCNKYM